MHLQGLESEPTKYVLGGDNLNGHVSAELDKMQDNDEGPLSYIIEITFEGSYSIFSRESRLCLLIDVFC